MAYRVLHSFESDFYDDSITGAGEEIYVAYPYTGSLLNASSSFVTASFIVYSNEESGVYRLRFGESFEGYSDWSGSLKAHVSASGGPGFFSASAILPTSDFTGTFIVKLTMEAFTNRLEVTGSQIYFLENFASPAPPPVVLTAYTTSSLITMGLGVMTGNLGGNSLLVTIGYGESPFIPPSNLPFFKGLASEPRGIRLANIRDGRADRVVHGGPRVVRINSVQNIYPETVRAPDEISGVVQFRFARGNKKVPEAVRHYSPDSVNEFGEPILPLSS